jgi:mannosyltransferase OCH1-like enzyme
MRGSVNGVPRTIGFMWLQGFDNAPMLIKKCFASWKRHNPNWNIVFLDEENMALP